MADVVSPDAKVREQGPLFDLINGEYRELSDAQRLAAVLFAILKPDLDPHSRPGPRDRILAANPRFQGRFSRCRLQGGEALPIPTPHTISEARQWLFQRTSPRRNPLVFAAANPRAASAADDNDKGLQFEAIEQLGKAGPAAASALPMLARDFGEQE